MPPILTTLGADACVPAAGVPGFVSAELLAGAGADDLAHAARSAVASTKPAMRLTLLTDIVVHIPRGEFSGAEPMAGTLPPTCRIFQRNRNRWSLARHTVVLGSTH